uniref:Uncharacterized protein n=1 Tax=Bionectria ochroleuca TaxID=29856 RepID=A0A8H7K5H7_BIOOC
MVNLTLILHGPIGYGYIAAWVEGPSFTYVDGEEHYDGTKTGPSPILLIPDWTLGARNTATMEA